MSEPTYRYLDLGGAWPGSSADGVAIEGDGALRLAVIAGDPVTLADPSVGALGAIAGLGVAADGTVYVADAEAHRIVVIACDGSSEPFACIDGPGEAIGRVDGPRAVLVGPRDALYVADTGNRRVQVIDRATGVVTGVWTGFVAPVDLAADGRSRVYVADRDAPRVARFDADGSEDAAFATALAASGAPPVAPIAVAILRADEAERLVVVDGAAMGVAARLRVYTLDGEVDPALDAELGRIVADDIAQAVASDDALYVATPNGVLAVGLDGRLLGQVSGVHGAVSGVALDCEGRVVIGGSSGVTTLAGRRRATDGRILVGPVPLPGETPRWDRVVVELDAPLAAASHLRIWSLTTAGVTPPGVPTSMPEAAERVALAPLDTWRAAPRDAHDSLLLHEPAATLWLCLELAGDGTTTPAVRALRVDHLGLGPLGKLPAMYARDDVDAVGWRLTNLLAAPIDELAAAIADLPRLFDADAAPDRESAPWLTELATWVQAPVDVRMDPRTRRDVVASAFVEHGRRGTRAALEASLTRAAGTAVTITEPAAAASIWDLGGEDSSLGVTTMLAAAEAQGAVVGTTAEVDRSHLIGEEDLGWPLYADLAHRFCVHVDAMGLRPERRPELEAAIEREKPAHTLAHLCVVEPTTSIGSQARIGVDMRVGGPPPTLRVDDRLDSPRSLNDQESPSIGGRIGQGMRIGHGLVPHGGGH